MIRAAMLILFVLLATVASSASDYRHQRKSQRITAKPMKWEARARAGYPWGQAAANTTGLVSGIPVGMAFAVLKFIGGRL